jgi:hypothetical protein
VLLVKLNMLQIVSLRFSKVLFQRSLSKELDGLQVLSVMVVMVLL